MNTVTRLKYYLAHISISFYHNTQWTTLLRKESPNDNVQVLAENTDSLDTASGPPNVTSCIPDKVMMLP